MQVKNKNENDKVSKYELIELRRFILEMKTSKKMTDLEILRYTYKKLGWLL